MVILLVAVLWRYDTSPIVFASTDDVKCTDCMNPQRPYFDIWGDKFDYKGSLIEVGDCPYSDPISHLPNPYCQQQPPYFSGK